MTTYLETVQRDLIDTRDAWGRVYAQHTQICMVISDYYENTGHMGSTKVELKNPSDDNKKEVQILEGLRDDLDATKKSMVRELKILEKIVNDIEAGQITINA